MGMGVHRMEHKGSAKGSILGRGDVKRENTKGGYYQKG